MKTTVCWSAVWSATLLIVAMASQAMAAGLATSDVPAFSNPGVTLFAQAPTSPALEPRGQATPNGPAAAPRNPQAPGTRPAPEAETTQEKSGSPPDQDSDGEPSPNGPSPAVVPGPAVPGTALPRGLGGLVPPNGPGPIAPPIPPPRIGFHYILIPGYGYKIVEVMPFSAAARMCLDYGDVILTLNGYPMTYYGADIPVRARAAALDGWLTAYIHDVHTGLLVTRSANLLGPAMPPPTPPPYPGGMVNGRPLPPPGATAPAVPQAKTQAAPEEKAARHAPEAKPSADEESQPPPPAEPAPPVSGKAAPTPRE